MNSEGLQRWIDAQVQALNPDSFMAQLAILAAVILGALLIAAAARQLSNLLPMQRNTGKTVTVAPVPQMAGSKEPQPAAIPAVLKSTISAEAVRHTFLATHDLSSRQKKKFTKVKPKKNYANIEKAPSDPMFLPPFDANVPYRDRLAMIGTNKDV